MQFKESVRSWLVLFRAHTAILEAPIAILGASLALGSFWNIEVLKWAIFGAGYHYLGYGMNSYADWKKGYDKNDPNKEHHPLNTGDIKPDTASLVIKALTVALLVYALYLTNLQLDSLVVLTVMITAGISYNYFGKVTEHKYLLLSAAHTCLFVLPYVAYTDSYANIVWVGAIAYFVHHVFQILISGDVKDIEMDESSLLQELGMSIKDENGKKMLDVDPSLVVISYLVAILEGVIVTAILLFLDPHLYIQLVTLLLMVWMIIEVDGIIAEGEFNRQYRVSAMSRKELAGLWMIFASFSSKIGLGALIATISFSMVYFIPVSYFMWGSLTPDV